MMYELMIAANIKTSEVLASKVDKALKESNAAGVKFEKLGKKTLAYPIEKQTEADYLLYNFDAEGEAVGKLTDVLRLEQDAVLRYLLVKTKVSKKSTIGTKGEEGAVEEVKTSKVTVKTKVVAKESKKMVKQKKGSKSKKGSK